MAIGLMRIALVRHWHSLEDAEKVSHALGLKPRVEGDADAPQYFCGFQAIRRSRMWIIVRREAV
ncbi:MAG: hypothetical protein KKH28_05000 [Elusimicrobia bacterium]|nr:hypothetical protein [Elusimicrobiota bacterium]